MTRSKCLPTTAIVFVLAFFCQGFAQQQVSSVTHTRFTLRSSILGEERTILVRVPFGYERSKQRFPVALMLDAHPPQNAILASIIESQASAGMMPEMILVGIQNTDRTRDLTPTKTDRSNSGGGEKFLDFIELELLPLIDKNYRTQAFRVFAGHSLGGLTVVHAMVSRPHLFGGYIAASPVLHWDRNFVIKETEEKLRAKKEFQKRLFVALGNEPDYTAGFDSFKGLLKKLDTRGFEHKFEQWNDEDHGSIVMRAYLAGMRNIFEGWQPKGPISNIAVLRSHYSNLSKRYGYEIDPPENLVNQLGYHLLRAGRIDDALDAFQENVRLYPESANVYDSLAEAFERSGSRSKALANYEKAFKMAELNGETQLAESARANLERLKAMD